MLDLVGNPEDRFSHNKAQIKPISSFVECYPSSSCTQNVKPPATVVVESHIHFQCIQVSAKHSMGNCTQGSLICANSDTHCLNFSTAFHAKKDSILFCLA